MRYRIDPCRRWATNARATDFSFDGGVVDRADVGVIGGSGLYEMEGLRDLRQIEVQTPFGPPSDALTIGTLDDVRVAFLPRHGRGHRLLPSEVPYRANIFALKLLGVRTIVSAS